MRPLLAAMLALASAAAACGGSSSPIAATPTAASPTTSATQGVVASPGGPATVPGPSTQAPTAAPVAAGPFSLLKMATSADPAKSAPDPSTFTTTYGPKAPAIYVVFELQPGLTGSVVCTMTSNGSPVTKPLTINYGATNTWGDFKIASLGTFATGTYQATVTFSATGQSMSTTFTVK